MESNTLQFTAASFVYNADTRANGYRHGTVKAVL